MPLIAPSAETITSSGDRPPQGPSRCFSKSAAMARMPSLLETKTPQESGVEQQKEQRDGGSADQQSASDGARPAAHLRGDEGGVVPAAVSQQHQHHRRRQRRPVPFETALHGRRVGCGQAKPTTRTPPGQSPWPASVRSACVCRTTTPRRLSTVRISTAAAGPEPLPANGTFQRGGMVGEDEAHHGDVAARIMDN